MSVLRSRAAIPQPHPISHVDVPDPVVSGPAHGEYAFALDLNVIQDLTKKLVPHGVVSDFSLSLADGRALPDWLELKHGHVLCVRSETFANITLRMDLVYGHGDVGRFEIIIDANVTPLKVRVKQVDTPDYARLFSGQLLSEDEPVVGTLPAAA